MGLRALAALAGRHRSCACLSSVSEVSSESDALVTNRAYRDAATSLRGDERLAGV